MGPVRIFSPRSETEKALATSLLAAHRIPVFVRGGHIGSPLPGPQISGYNTQSIMVPEECAQDATELLADLKRQSSQAASTTLSWTDRLRIVLEGLLFGWFVPASRERNEAKPTDDRNQAD